MKDLDYYFFNLISKLPIYLPIYLFLNKFCQFVSVISSKSNIQYTFVLKSQTLNEEFVYLHYFMKKIRILRFRIGCRMSRVKPLHRMFLIKHNMPNVVINASTKAHGWAWPFVTRPRDLYMYNTLV